LNKSVGTHKLYLAYEYEQCKAMQEIKRELRDSGVNANRKYKGKMSCGLLKLIYTYTKFI